MIITISGMPGSGKSTIGRMLAKKLGYKFYSMGDLRGRLAMDRGLTIDAFNKLGETEDWTDKEVDAYQKKLGQTEDNFIVDGWLSFHFIPHAFKIFLQIDPQIAAERVFNNPRPDEKRATDVKEQEQILRERMEQTDVRYRKYYDISFRDTRSADLLLDTSDLTPQEILDKILRALPNP